MISIIICSRKADISQELKDNIAATIGCEYELCVIDNSRNEYNIFTAYNEGVRRAKGDILCFMHEDILFHSENWGAKLIDDYEKDKKIGCIGVVGIQFLPQKPMAMWNASAGIGGVLQGQKDQQGRYFVSDDLDKDTKKLTEVVALDGCLISIRRVLFDLIQWDEKTYGGFHIYDMDICMQVLQTGYKVCVEPSIIIEHQSLGNATKEWYDSLQSFYAKWQNDLPIMRGMTMTHNELSWRNRMYDVVLDNQKLNDEIDRIHQSYAYRVGKFLLTPFSYLRRKHGYKR